MERSEGILFPDWLQALVYKDQKIFSLRKCQNAKEVEQKNKEAAIVVKCESRKATAKQASQKNRKKISEIVDKKKRPC